jgi:hypothetical protein
VIASGSTESGVGETRVGNSGEFYLTCPRETRPQ